MSRRARRFMVAGVAAAAILTAPSAKAGLFDGGIGAEALAVYLETYLVPVIELIEDLPEALEGPRLDALLTALGRETKSYLRTQGYGRFADLFPDNPRHFSPQDALIYAANRLSDRRSRVNEAMDQAAVISLEHEATSDRLDEFALRNADPLESVAGIGKLGNQIGIEQTSAVQKLTAITLETAQLEADQRLQEDWVRKQQAAYGEETLANGMWTGDRNWQPENLQVGW